MAQKRSSQRGVIRMASSVLLAGFAALLSVTGCSADQTSPDEHLGSSVQALTCNPLGGAQVCNTDDCTTFNCKALGGGCLLLDQKKDGEACTTLTNLVGKCVTAPGGKAPTCCTGCVVDNRGTLTCIDKPDVKACGADGSACVACNNGDACKVDICAKGGKCDTMPVPDDKVACQDAAQSPGSCYKGNCCAGCIDKNGACQGGAAVNSCGKPAGVTHADCKSCADTEVCTTDLCNTDGTCSHGKTADNTSCTNGNSCDGLETCQGGLCTKDTTFKCPADTNPCHQPSCDASLNCSQKLLDNVPCPDADKCNGVEMCNNGACSVPGTPVKCDDSNPCTIDSCDSMTGGCIHTPGEAGKSCDDGNLCNGIGICDANAICVLNPSPKCDDGNPCTDDSCDPTPVTGGCKTANNAADCSDNDPCTALDKCSGGKCVSSGALKCDDGNSCTADTCMKGVGCQNTAVANTVLCDDGNDCSDGDHCQAGVCTPTGGTLCPDDNNPCTTSSCDPKNGSVCTSGNDDTAKCQLDQCHQFSQCSGGTCPAGTLIDCDDANPCTTDSCDPASGCTHVANDKATCSDGDLCTLGDACKAGKCVSKDQKCQPIDECHVAGTCNPKTGLCDDPRADDTIACDSGNGYCETGKCIPNPGGSGGAGGEGPGAGGAAGEGTGVAQGGEPVVVVGSGGAGDDTSIGGEPGKPSESGGKAGKSAGGSTTVEGGEAAIPDHVFVRDPGGCSCTLPSSRPNRLAWLAGLALAGMLIRRRGRAAGANRRFGP